jgi:hypothetical protein
LALISPKSENPLSILQPVVYPHQEQWGRSMLKQDVEYIQDLSTQLAQIAKSRNLSVLAFLLEMAALESSSICDQLKKRSSRAAAL